MASFDISLDDMDSVSTELLFRFLCLGMLSWATPMFAQDVFMIDSLQKDINISHKLQYFIDSSAALSFNEIKKQHFQPVKRNVLISGKHHLWNVIKMHLES